MLKKLRIKFILIIMTIVTIMLGMIFAFLYNSTSRNLRNECMEMMTQIAENPSRSMLPQISGQNIKLPYFSILISMQGTSFQTGGGFFDLTDTELIKKIVAEASDSHVESGLLKDYNLRFLHTVSPFGECFVFVDITSELSTLKNLIRAFVVIGSIAFLVFLAISFLLARWSVRPVENAWNQQKQFVADASHELKTPLTVITTDAELINSPECSDDERSQLSSGIISMSRQMRGLVENLLELARMDNGSINNPMSLVSLSDIATEECMIFEPIFFDKEIGLEYEITPNLTLSGNSDRLKQLIGILLDNASKYSTPNGKTFLSLTRKSSKKILLKVSNEGMPIPEKELKNLFKRFYRLDESRSSSHSNDSTSCHSYGLGLSIAEGIVKMHNGKIWAESKDGIISFFAEL